MATKPFGIHPWEVGRAQMMPPYFRDLEKAGREAAASHVVHHPTPGSEQRNQRASSELVPWVPRELGQAAQVSHL